MRIKFAVSAILLFTALPSIVYSDEESSCNYVHLVQCFIEILDEWAWTLYELKDGVLSANASQCKHLQELEKCIDDKWDKTHSCSHSEVVEASHTVSDLLTHRKHSGSFLRSYYLLKYVCSEEGQNIVSRHRECLTNEKVTPMILSAGTYLSEKFLENKEFDDDFVCDAVNDRLKEYVTAVQGIDKCPNEAAHLMCKSLVDMFEGLHSDKLSECKEQLHCSLPPKEEKTTTDSGEHDINKGDQGGLNGQVQFAALAFSPLLALLVPLLALR